MDTIDIKILRAFTNTLKAVFIYLQSLDFEATNWILDDNGTMTHIKDIDEITPVQTTIFLDNNTNLFTYADESKLAEFKTAFIAAEGHYSAAVSALNDLGQTGRRERTGHAFNIETEFDMAMWVAVRDKLLDTVIKAFDDSTQEIDIVTNKNVSGGIYVDSSDNAYWQSLYNIYVSTYEPNGGDYITLYDLFSGTKSPRDLMNIAMELGEEESYDPYQLKKVENNPVLYAEEVPETDWNEPFDTYTIAETVISIDGNTGDWDSVPAIYSDEDHGVAVKIATDTGGNVYIYLESPAGQEQVVILSSWHHESSRYSNLSLENNDGIVYGSYYDVTTEYQHVETEGNIAITSNETSHKVEAKYPASILNSLTVSRCINNFYLNAYTQYAKDLKLLPEVEPTVE